MRYRDFLVLFAAVLLVNARGASVNTLYSFGDAEDGASPSSGVIQARDGNLYGTAINGGTNGWGTVFRVSPSASFSPLYSFSAGRFNAFGNFTNSEGATPNGALLQTSNGLFYGTAEGGGTNGNGAIYQMTTAGGVSPLYSFSAGATNAADIITNSDGATPLGALVQGRDGYFYGTASEGGLTGNGTIFKMTPAGGLTPLYSFSGGIDGAAPWAALVLAPNGIFYGTCTTGGSNGFGSIFQITSNGNFTSLYSFTNGIDGAFPETPLVAAGGNLYGTAYTSGGSSDGTVFVWKPGGFVSLYQFTGNADGANPTALTLGNDGNFYGTTATGGTGGAGAIFSTTPSGNLTPLYSFSAVSQDSSTNTDGSNPSGLIQGSDGNFYGTTSAGGTNGSGTVFSASFILSFLVPGGVQYSNGQTTLQLTGLNGQGPIVIQASTNLLNWVPISTNPPTVGQLQIVDPNAGNYKARFYRAVVP